MSVLAVDMPVAEAAGRLCPADYNYAPSVFARAPDFAAETLYVAGGLYGNDAALATIERMAAHEGGEIVLNGDFHWFDADPCWFAGIEQGVAPRRSLRGNVETELARRLDVGAGCGCAYPEGVDDGLVRRSNEMLMQLSAAPTPAARARLQNLPMHMVVQLGGLRVGIVHGDATSLAGWRFAQDALDAPRQRRWLDAIRAASCIDIFACTHTCLAALRDFALPAGRLTVVNNGAAGMPNFLRATFGIITRIATTPSPHPSLYGLRRDGIHVDALPVAYDVAGFLRRFLARWPTGSAAHASYFGRITQGPDYRVAQAAPR